MTRGLSIGDLAARTGLSVPAIRHYETLGLLAPLRNAGGHRRYDRSDIRRLSFVRIAQGLGFPLAELAQVLAGLPQGRPPSRQDWAQIGSGFRVQIDARIAALEGLRDRLDGCIGCGCLSLDKCALWNPGDAAARHGPGPRWLMGDRHEPD
ncbi:MAG: redox-sensitive transcriptional activator SoxR [Rhodobacteraceae bacterium]|nr:redox-sensitive transcriptional activator SoxR [Paracoccaceae bacterium]